MQMMSLHPSHPHATTEVDTTNALVEIQTILEEGVSVNTNTFRTREGDSVTLFWTTDGSGHVATVWEHLFPRVQSYNVTPEGLAEESSVLSEAARVTVGRDVPCPDSDDYAVGE